ncbi:MAG: hypothetical protein KGM99_14610 [Burkholderiales bacterium]|nr:hypothetical protein [Burkholderiales bacterium]
MKARELIEAAAEKAGSQRKLATLIDVQPGNLTEMKQGKRTCSLAVRARLAEVAGYDLKRAVIEGAIEELEGGDATEKEAARGLRAILKAFPARKLERAMGIEPTS